MSRIPSMEALCPIYTGRAVSNGGWAVGCAEWSDGRLSCLAKTVSIVQKSPDTGKFVWLGECERRAKELGIEPELQHFGFDELSRAYNEFKPIGKLCEPDAWRLMLEIVHAYNDTYCRGIGCKDEIPVNDYKLFVEVAIELARAGREHLPLSLIIELYREAGMFSKCFEMKPLIIKSCDESEIIDEILFRAAKGDSTLFLFEEIDYFVRNFRPCKRVPCPFA